MSKDKITSLQQHLLVRSSQLRQNFSVEIQCLVKPLAAADRIQAYSQWLYRNPKWPLSIFAILVLMRPKRIIPWGYRACLAFKKINQFKKFIRNFASA
jgi:hypothetical protein